MHELLEPLPRLSGLVVLGTWPCTPLLKTLSAISAARAASFSQSMIAPPVSPLVTVSPDRSTHCVVHRLHPLRPVFEYDRHFVLTGTNSLPPSLDGPTPGVASIPSACLSHHIGGGFSVLHFCAHRPAVTCPNSPCGLSFGRLSLIPFFYCCPRGQADATEVASTFQCMN